MPRGLIFFILLIVILGGFFSYQITHAYFSNSGQSTGNTFQAAAVFPTPTPTPSVASIVVNEVSPEGSSPTEWVELFNSANSSINVTGWIISDGTGDDIFPATSPIPANGYAVVVSNTSTVSVPSGVIKIQLGSAIGSSGLTDGGEKVILKNQTSSIMDQMSYGNDHTVFASPPAAPASGKTLGRIPNGQDTDAATDWRTNLNPTLGVSN